MIKLSKQIESMGFSLQDVDKCDFEDFYQVRKECSKIYVDKFLGGWKETFQRKFNFDIFLQSFSQNYFQKVILNEKIVGFCTYTIFEDFVGCITLQILNVDNREDIMKWLLEEIIKISKKTKLPDKMKVF